MEILENELIRGLKTLGENDRDIRTLTIWCNPNFIRRSDKNIKPEILKILDKLKKQKIIRKKTKKIDLGGGYNIPKKFIIYSLI